MHLHEIDDQEEVLSDPRDMTLWQLNHEFIFHDGLIWDTDDGDRLELNSEISQSIICEAFKLPYETTITPELLECYISKENGIGIIQKRTVGNNILYWTRDSAYRNGLVDELYIKGYYFENENDKYRSMAEPNVPSYVEHNIDQKILTNKI